MTQRKFCLKPDKYDARDRFFSIQRDRLINLPPRIDLRSQCPPVYNQLSVGSCTANSIAGGIQFDQMRQGLPIWTPSRLFIYFNERAIEGTTSQDAGASLRDGIKSVAAQGVCDEALWPYVDDGSTFATRPTDEAYTAAVPHKLISYTSVLGDIQSIRAVLAMGLTVCFGIQCFAEIMSDAVAASGIVPMPADPSNSLGGHAVLAVGYDDDQQQIITRNSWGVKFGQQGYMMLQYDYLDQFGSDYWNIKVVA